MQPPTTAEILVSLLQASQETARALATLAGELRADRDYREYRIQQMGRPSRQVDVADAPMADSPATTTSTRPTATRVRIKDEPDTTAPATPSADAKQQSTSAPSATESLATPPLPPRASTPSPTTTPTSRRRTNSRCTRRHTSTRTSPPSALL